MGIEFKIHQHAPIEPFPELLLAVNDHLVFWFCGHDAFLFPDVFISGFSSTFFRHFSAYYIHDPAKFGPAFQLAC